MTAPATLVTPPAQTDWRRILLLGTFALALAIPVLATTFHTVREHRLAIEESFRFEAERIVDTLADGMSEPVWNLRPEGGRALAEAALSDPRVLAVRVESDAQGDFIRLGTGTTDDHGARTITRAVTREGERIGTVLVLFDTGYAAASFARRARSVWLTGAFEIAIVFLLVTLLGSLYARHQRVSLLRDANARLSREVEERRRTELALRESEELFRGVIDNSPVCITVKDLDRRYRFTNAVFAQWYGRDSVSMHGRHVSEIHPPEAAREIATLDSKVLSEGCTLTLEYEMLFRDGRRHTVVSTKFAVTGANGTPVGVGTISTDVTEQRRTEDALRRAQRLEAVGQLTGGLAHDFNNLLAVVGGNAELLRDDIGDHASLRMIERAVQRGAEVTERLLSFSRRQTLQPGTIDLCALLDEVRVLLQQTFTEAVTIDVVVSDDIWPVTADAGQLENALLNLAFNARDAMEGSGRFEIRCVNVTRTATGSEPADEVEAGDYVCIEVSDTGCGMSEEVLAHVFEPFYTTKEVGRGSGLGLSMVYGFARQSGGWISADSEPGTGTIFRLCLPRADERASTRPLPAEDDAFSIRGRGETILVLEDEPDVREFIARSLTALGYRVQEAGDAREAATILDSPNGIDLMLSDVVLPGGTHGPAAGEAARKTRPDLPIVFMSGHTPDPDMHAVIERLGSPLLKKPFGLADLARTVAANLRKARQAVA